MTIRNGYASIFILLAHGLAVAAEPVPIPGLGARLRLPSLQVQPGHPVWVQFLVENTSNEAITITVPNTQPKIPSPETGLPLSHIFSSGGASSVSVMTEAGRKWEQAANYHLPADASILTLAPKSAVGTTLDLRDYFPVLRGAGQYKIAWRPYGGSVQSEPITVTIAPQKQVEIVTDEGILTVRFFYDEAPNHVANFLDLVKTGFYTGTMFHRLEPGYLLQGGCPRNDGTGIRHDGKRISAEFNSRPHQKGSLSMALLDDDPDSASCQFFICNTRQKEWDGKYSVFGELVGQSSLDTLDHLMATPIDDSGRPTKNLYVRSVRILDAPVEVPVSSP